MSAPSALAIVPFVSVANMMKLVHHIGIEQILSDIALEIETDFKRWPLFDKTARVPSHSDVGVIELMPTSDGELYAFKYVNGHPKNAAEGLQTVTGLGLLAEVQSGYPILVSEMTLLTALRTAATSAVATKYLAPKGAKTMARLPTKTTRQSLPIIWSVRASISTRLVAIARARPNCTAMWLRGLRCL